MFIAFTNSGKAYVAEQKIRVFRKRLFKTKRIKSKKISVLDVMI